MTRVPRPVNEAARLQALHSYDILDTAAEASFDSIVNLAARLTGASASMISLIDAERQWFKARYAIEETEAARDTAFCTHAILNPDQMLIVPEALDDPRFAKGGLVLGGSRIRFYAGQPLVSSEGYALGTLCVIGPQPRDVSEDERYTLKVLADSVMTTLEFRRLARIDALTGLPNRGAFMVELNKKVAALKLKGEPVCILYLDLDGLKLVNDLHGHEVGDRLLRQVALSLRSMLPAKDIVARIGGDEFAILVQQDPDIAALAERLRVLLRDSMRALGWEVTASIGAVTLTALSVDGATALREADRALYNAKRSGRDRVVCRTIETEADLQV